MRTSPFNKIDSDKDVHFLVKKSKQAATEAHNAITNIFPNSGDVPHSIRLYSALFYLAVVCATFAYLLITGFNATLGTEFLEPYLGNNAAPDRHCSLVPISYTGNFLLARDGFWEGSNKFTYNLATYNLDVTSYTATSYIFRQDMTSIYTSLKQYGELAKTQALDKNLLLWMSLVFVNQSSNAKRLTLTGDPLVVFSRDNIVAAVSSVSGNCNVSSTSSFDNSNGMMSVSWNYKAFMAEPKCTAAMNPEYFGFDMLTKPDMFTLSFDIRTIISGVAVNLGFLKLEQLEEITEYRQHLHVGTQQVYARFFYDPRYAGMKPLRCVTVDNSKPYCTYRINDVIMFPMLHHAGANLTQPHECTCSELTLAQLSDKTHNCNVFRFLSGFIYVSGPYATSANYSIGLLLHKLHGSHESMIQYAHRPMFIASSYGQNSPSSEDLNSPSSLAAAYDFCSYNGLSCSFLTFTSYDVSPTSWAVSNYYTIMTNGACMDTITPAADAWERVIDVPYGPLVQNYQQCKHDVYTTLVNQAGIAIGNLQVVAPLVVIFLMLVTYLHKWWNKVPLDESYTKAEKDSALDAYAMSLLLSRDEKLKTTSFRGKNSIIALIAEELSEHTMLSAVSHKNNHSNYSSHSLNSPSASKVYAKLRAINSFVYSRTNPVSPMQGGEETIEMTDRALEQQLVPGAQGRVKSHKLEIITGDQQEGMSMREWIVAKKRGGSLCDLENGGLNLYDSTRQNTATVSISNSSQSQMLHSNRRSVDYSDALKRVLELEPDFGKGPPSFAADSSSRY